MFAQRIPVALAAAPCPVLPLGLPGGENMKHFLCQTAALESQKLCKRSAFSLWFYLLPVLTRFGETARGGKHKLFLY